MTNARFKNNSEQEISLILKDIKVLPSEKIFEMVKEYKKTKSEFLLNDIIEQNYRLVWKIAAEYKKRFPLETNFEVVDLFQEGLMGVLRAIELFDPDKEFMFSTYVVSWIRCRIERYIDQNIYSLHVPVYASQIMRKIYSDIKSTGEVMTPEEISKKYEVSEYNAKSMYDILYNRDVSLNDYATMKDSKNKEINDELSSVISNEEESFEDKIIDDTSRKAVVNELLDKLSEREREIITGYYGIGVKQMNFRQLGEKFNCSHQRIQQIKNRAMKKLYINALNKDYFDVISEVM